MTSPKPPAQRRRGAAPPPGADAIGARVAAVAARLRKDGLKHSEVRDAVVEEFFRAGRHLTVDELLERARARAPETGYSTVYRTLKLLVQHGFASERDFGGAHTLFEPADTPHHDHAICTVCGEVMEFEDDELEALQLRIARRLGLELQAHRLELYGRCKACAAGALRSSHVTSGRGHPG